MSFKNKKEAFDYLFRIVMVGDSGVGKTNLLHRYTKNEYHANLPSTVGIDFSFRNVNIDSKIIRACIWDTAGQDKFRSISTAYYHGSAAAILVYDITNYKSFKNLTTWLDDLRKYAEDNIVLVLVGNKCDLAHLRQVETLEAKSFAESYKLSFIETSALDGINVEKAFENALKEVYNLRINKNLEQSDKKLSNLSKRISTIKITNNDNNNNDELNQRNYKNCCPH